MGTPETDFRSVHYSSTSSINGSASPFCAYWQYANCPVQVQAYMSHRPAQSRRWSNFLRHSSPLGPFLIKRIHKYKVPLVAQIFIRCRKNITAVAIDADTARVLTQVGAGDIGSVRNAPKVFTQHRVQFRLNVCRFKWAGETLLQSESPATGPVLKNGDRTRP